MQIDSSINRDNVRTYDSICSEKKPRTNLAEVTSSRKIFHSFRSQTLFLFLSINTKLSVATLSSSLGQLVVLTLEIWTNIESWVFIAIKHSMNTGGHFISLRQIKSETYPTDVVVVVETCDRKNSLSSLRNSSFRGSGHPFIGLEIFIAQSGRPSLIDVPGIFLPVSSWTHQQ